MSKTVLALALLSVCTLANAHFGSVIPDKQIVSDPKDSTLTITAAFNHPMEQAGMTMEKPKNEYSAEDSGLGQRRLDNAIQSCTSRLL